MKGLSPSARRFVLHWGEMGTRWGINRTVAQIHALLFLAEKPLNAEDIAETLKVARSNVSTSLKELQNWGIVRLVHRSEDRRDYFESLKDVYQMFRVIALERKRREIDPTLGMIRGCLAEADDGQADAITTARLKSMLEFFELADKVARQLERIPTPALIRMAKMSDSLLSLVGLGPGEQMTSTFPPDPAHLAEEPNLANQRSHDVSV
ncbi:MAG: GbsR/MarR family transcriptional regulator [Verrucomicrobiales bacterium]